jgi:hypothetical protein
MKVDCALLCDAVTVREGLLHILGGGVTRVARPSFPAPLGVELALRLTIHPTETNALHTGEVRLQSQDGGEIAKVEFGFNVDPVSAQVLVPGELLSLPLALPMQNVAVPSAGGYSFEILIDHVHQTSVPFQIVQQEQQGGMP